jgi:hypothetical protein
LHAPQLKAFVWVSTHAPPHASGACDEQVHWPFVHAAVGRHAVLHAPQ